MEVIVIQYLYTLLNDPMVSLVTTCPHTKLLQYCWLYLLHYIWPLHDSIYFITASLYLLIPSLFYLLPNPSLLWNQQFVSWIYESGFDFALFGFVSLFCFLGSMLKWNHRAFVFLSDLFHLALFPLDTSMLSQMGRFHSFFYRWVIFYCRHMDVDVHTTCFPSPSMGT